MDKTVNYNNNIGITGHGYSRLRERNGWNRKTAERMTQKVYRDGARYADIKGYLRIWLKQYGRSENAEYVLYGKSLYIFKEGMLITAFNVPNRETVRSRCY